ncbi:MAG: hypothetical protein K1X67_13050 [Fimbriimonadaceae bacterium]|nr:hypothetical protein [Fimbriimonadaceae bacterium]
MRFQDGAVEAFPAEQICIRQEAPFCDVLKAVQVGAVEDPEPYLARRDLAKQLIQQRAACRGYDGVPSSAIGFYDHQLETLQRVLQDPICRFILADEVGLGKTIEAGLVIRQTLLDDANAEIYISAPSALVQQWRNELHQKFLLDGLLEDRGNRRARVRVREHRDIFESAIDLHKPRLLVVDEAHQLFQLALQTKNWPLLSKLCHSAHGLLLLSATPMRGDYITLEALLHLVDPIAFPFGNHLAFAERIEARTTELSDFDALASPFSGPIGRATALESIRSRHPDDPYVSDAVHHIAASASESRIEELGHYLRETYRISRRMVRHRRDVGPASDFPTAGRNLVVLEVPANANDRLIDEFLERYREIVHDSVEAARLMWEAVAAALAGCAPLNEFLDNRIARLHCEDSGEADEFDLMNEVRARLILNEDERLRASVREACRRVRNGQRVVAISGFTAHATKFADAASVELGSEFAVLRHLCDTPQVLRNELAEEFLFWNSGILLVGDTSLEEGTNLQGSDALLNIDLSLSPNRIEQRVGRLDRYSGTGSIRRNEGPPDIIAVLPVGSNWCSAQITLLAEGVRVFGRSVSTAQRFLAKWESQLHEKLIPEGIRALDQDREVLHQQIQEEMAEVDELEAWESDFQQDSSNALSAECLNEYERRSASLELALLNINDPKAGLPFRLVSHADSTFSFSLRPGVRTSPPLNNSAEKLLARSYTVSVTQALELGVGTPFRIGDPFVDWLQNYLLTDERGRAFVAIVGDAKAMAWEFWLRCDFQLEFNEASLSATPESDRRRLRRRGESFLPPRLFSVWANGSAVAIDSSAAELDMLLECKQAERRVDWSELHRQLPAWETECAAAAAVGRTSVRESDLYKECISAAVSQVELDNVRRQSVLRARAERLPTESERSSAINDFELERQLGQLILDGVKDPKLQLVNCGALIRRPTWNP